MAWLDFIKAIRQDDEEEQKRRDQTGFGGWWGDVQNSWDNLVDTGSAVVRGDFAEAGRQGKDYLGDVGRGLGGMWEAVEDTAQGVVRGVGNIGLSVKEAGRNNDINGRNAMIDQIKGISKEDRDRFANMSPEEMDKLSQEDWSKAFIIRRAKDQLGDLSDETLDKRKAENEKEKGEHLTYTPDNPVAKFFLGGEEGETMQSGQKTNADAKKFLNEQGIEGPAANVGAGIFAGGMLALDAPTGLGSVVKSVGKQGIKELAGEATEEGVKTILKKRVPSLSDDAIKEVGPRIAAMTDEKQIVSALEEMGAKVTKGLFKQKPGDVIANTKETMKGVLPGMKNTAQDLATNAKAAIDDVIDDTAATVTDAMKQAPKITPPGKPSGYGEQADVLLGRIKSGSEITDSTNKGFRQSFREQFVDKLSPVNDMVKMVEEKTGKKLVTEDNPYELMRLYQGMPDRVQQRVGTLVDTLKQAPDLDAVRIIGTGNQLLDRSRRGISNTIDDDTVRGAIDGVRARLGDEKFDRAARVVDAVTEYNRGLLDDLHENGIISDDAFRAINEVGANYFSKLNVVDYIMKNDANRALFASSNSYNTTKQSLNKLISGAKGMDEGTEILDPVEAIVMSTDKAMRAIAKNDIWKSFDRLADEVPELVVRARDPNKVAERITLSLENKDLRPIRNKLDRMIKTRGSWVRRLESQINQLEKKGLNLSLKTGGQRMDSTPFNVAGLGGDVPTSQVGKMTTDFVDTAEGIVRDPAKAITNLGRRRDDLLRKADEALPENVPGATLPRPISDFQDAITIRGKADDVQKKIGDVMKGPAKAVDSAVNPSQLGTGDTGSFVRNLIENGSRSDIDKIKKMVGNRDTKLVQLLDEIGEMKSNFDDVAGTIKQNIDKTRELADQKAPEGFAYISGFGQGIQGKLAVPKEIADVFTGKNKAQQDYLASMIDSVNSFVKQNFTSNNPAFALITNPIRDAKTFAYNAKDVKADPFSIGKALVGGLAQRVRRGDIYDRWVAAGGKSGFYADERMGEDIAKDIVREVGGKRWLGAQVDEVHNAKDLMRNVGRVMTAPLRTARDKLHGAASILEDAPRVAQFQASLKAGKTDAQAAFNARNVTVDFQQSGRIGQIVNAWIPFLNARFQGTLKTVDAVKSNPARAAAVYAGLTAAPILATALNNNQYPEVLKMINESERENNFIIVLGDGVDEEGKFNQVIKIPKSDVDKVLGNPLENFARWMADDDPDTLAETVTKMIGSFLPVDTVRDGKFSAERTVGGLIPPLLKAPIESVTNRNLYFGSDIVPESMQNLPDAEQVRRDDPNTEKVERETSPIAQFLASLTGGSPIKMENTVRNFTGSLLTEMPQDQLGGKLSGAGSNQMNNEFYKILDKTSKNKTSASRYINEALARNDYAAAQKAADSYNAYLREQFTPFGERYGAQMTPQLAELYEQQKIILTKRSIGQRRRNQLERQAAQ